MIIYFLIIIISTQPSLVWFWYYWQLFPSYTILFFLLFPLVFLIGIIILIFSSIIVAKIFLTIIKLLHTPREGVFERNKKDKDYCYWSLRSVIRKWPLWLVRQLYLPFFEVIALKSLGIKTYNKTCVNWGWIDCEFIKIGENVKIGQGSIVMSNILIQNKLIIKNVVLKNNCIIGAHSVVSPGTIIEENTILEAQSLTSINQKLEANSVYTGNPAKKAENNTTFENWELLENLVFVQGIKSREENENLKENAKELSIPFHVYILSGWWIVGGSYILPGILFFTYLFEFLIPNLFSIPFSVAVLFTFRTLIFLVITPLVFIGIYLLHLFFVALFTMAFYRFADYRGPGQGIFDRNLDENSKALDYYHWRSFLMKYPILAFVKSPFPWLLNWELKFIGSNKIGKGTTFEESIIHSHLDFGKNNYIGTFAHISNHIVDGVYGSENLTFFGAKIGNNCIFNALMGGMPGLEVGNDATFLPMTTTLKYDKLDNDGIYLGFPVRKVPLKKLEGYYGGIFDE